MVASPPPRKLAELPHGHEHQASGQTYDEDAAGDHGFDLRYRAAAHLEDSRSVEGDWRILSSTSRTDRCMASWASSAISKKVHHQRLSNAGQYPEMAGA